MASPTSLDLTPDARLLLSTAAQKLYRSEQGVYSRAASVLIREHYYFASKSFVAVREAFNIAHLDREMLNKKTTLVPHVNLYTLFQFRLRFQHKAQYK
jgi:hypothetical protein